MTAHSTEIAKPQISHIEATPALPGIGEALDKYMWVYTISHTPMTDLLTGRQWQLLRIVGNIKPDPDAEDAVALRYGFLVSFEAIVMILDTAGARWAKHPEFAINGQVRTEKDGSQSFCVMEASIDLELLA